MSQGFSTWHLTLTKLTLTKKGGIELEFLKNYLKRKVGRHERFAIRNLIGVLLSQIGEHVEAMPCFDDILSDPEGTRNLNALANRIILCETLHRSSEAMRCKERLALNEDEMSKIERARCFAEQGYAFANDIHGEYVTHQRFTNTLDYYTMLYTKALDNCKDVVSKEERLDWVLGKARALHKICRTKQKTGICWTKNL